MQGYRLSVPLNARKIRRENLSNRLEFGSFRLRLDGVESGACATALVTQQNQIGAAANTELSQEV